jgi:hypothetical protein
MPHAAPRTALVAVLASACLGAAPAHAQTTVLPQQALSNVLSLSIAPVSATLTGTTTSVSGTLGTTTVVDGRLASNGYDVNVTSTGFDLFGAPVTSSATTHIPGTAASAQATSATGGTLSTTALKALPASPLFHLTYPSSVLSLNLTTTYTLALSISIPAAAAAGRYTGTVTQTLS